MGRKKKKIEPVEKKPEVEESVDNSAEEESMDEIPQIKEKSDEKEFNKFVSSIEKEFGEGTIASADDIFFVEKVPTRNLLLDILTEGGLPKGSITLFYGPFQCLDADTFIPYSIVTDTGKKQNHKGGRIELLYKRFHGLERSGKGYYQRPQTENSDFYISSIDENGLIFRNKIADVVKCGKKPCFELITQGGHKIVCTKEHKFYIGGGIYKELKDLNTNDILYVHNNIKQTTNYKTLRYREKCVKYHPMAGIKYVGKYKYYRVKLSRLIIEADLNNLSLEGYINILNTKSKKEISKLKFLSKHQQVHHKDLNHTNDVLENLEILTKEEHNKLHLKLNPDRFRCKVVTDTVKSIKSVGNRETYDIKCFFPYNNFIANKFVVHNSGKTVTSLEIAAIFTSQKIPILYIACEGDIDKSWVVKIGNDLKYFYVAKPKNLEDAINLAEVAVCSKKFGLVIFDSVTAGIPREALDKKTENDQMALQARRNTKLVQKVTSALQPENLKDPNSYNNTMVILIAHLRHKVGFVMGSSDTLPGGEALKHHSSYIIKVRGGTKLKNKEEVIGRELHFNIERSKYSVPFVSGVTEFYFNPPRFNNAKVLLTYAAQYGIIERAGPYYSYKDVKVQGQKELLKTLKEKNLLNEIKQKLIYKFSEEN